MKWTPLSLYSLGLRVVHIRTSPGRGPARLRQFHLCTQKPTKKYGDQVIITTIPS